MVADRGESTINYGQILAALREAKSASGRRKGA
jgi:hypothetical protein